MNDSNDKGWCVRHDSCGFLFSTLAISRSKAIELFLFKNVPHGAWKNFRKVGFECVRVKLVLNDAIAKGENDMILRMGEALELAKEELEDDSHLRRFPVIWAYINRAVTLFKMWKKVGK